MRNRVVSVIIPAFNEEATVGRTVAALRRLREVGQIVVVDDGSRDGTAAVAGRAGAFVVRLPRNRGKGAALAHGLGFAAGPIISFVDADLGDSAVELRRLVRPVFRGAADMAVARLPRYARSGGFGLASRVAAWGIRALTGAKMRAPLSGQRAMRRELVQALGGIAGGFGVEVGLTVDALRAGFRVIEVQTSMRHRLTHRDLRGFLHRGRQFCDVVGVLASRCLRP